MLDSSPLPRPAEPRPPRPIGEFRAPSRPTTALQLVLLVVATTLVIGFVAASAFAGLLYQLFSIAR